MPISHNYFKIGLFAFTGVALLVAGLLAFGLMGTLFKKPQLVCITFFDRSVQGLSEDSPVKFRGFKVGKVTSISLASVDDPGGQPVVKVIFEIAPTSLAGQEENADQAKAYIAAQTTRGLKVVLTSQGVTGIAFLDLDYTTGDDRAENMERARSWAQSQNMVFIPSAPGQIMEIGEAVSRIVKSLGDVDFAGISRDLKTLVETVNNTVDNLDTARISTDFDETLNEIRLAAGELTTLLRNADETIRGGSNTNLGREVEATVQQVRRTLKGVDQVLGSSQSNLPLTLDNLRVMSENLRELSELLKAQPSQALFGQPPQPSKPARNADAAR